MALTQADYLKGLTPEQRARAGFGYDPAFNPADISQLGYDPEFDSVKRRLSRELALKQSGVDEDINNVNLDLGVRQHALEKQHPIDLKNILEGFAGRGMLHSGRYIDENNNAEAQYGEQISGLATEKANRLSAIQRALGEFQSNQMNQLDEAQKAYAGRLASQAEKQAAADAARNQASTDALVAANPGFDPAGAKNEQGQYYTDPQQQADALGFNNAPAQNVAAPSGALSSYQEAYPVATKTAAPAAKPSGQAALGIGSTRPLNTWDANSQNRLRSGATVVAGNGYSYKLVNGVPVRVG